MDGRTNSDVTVVVGSRNPVKVRAVTQVMHDIYDGQGTACAVHACDAESDVPPQPLGLETIFDGARNRARNALASRENVTYGVGIEAGIYEVRGVSLDVQFCVILDVDGWMTVGHSGGFAYPPSVLSEVEKGHEIGDIFASLSGNENIKREQGAIGMLSKGHVDRTAFTRHAVLMAMVPRLSPELYK